MIKLKLELQDWDGCGEDKVVTIPSNIRSELNSQSEYVIIDCVPSVPDIQAMDIWKLNSVIDEINSENPSMTAEFLALIMEAVDGDLGDDEFVRRIKENDFMFEDLSDITWKMGNEDVAACYIATELKVPFDTGITREILDFLSKDEITDYIDWSTVWEQYEAMGFRIVEDLESEEYSLYLIHWREQPLRNHL